MIVSRHNHHDLGIRAHPDMDVAKCLISVFMIHQNEFIFIWLFLGFAIFFWVYSGQLLARDKSLGFKDDDSYLYMSVSVIPIAVSITMTAIYLTFYSISSRVQFVLRLININIKVFAAYATAIIWLIALMSTRPVSLGGNFTLLELYIYILLGMYFVVLIMIQFGKPVDSIAILITIITLGVIALIDFAGFSTHEQNTIFYLPLVIMLAVLTVFYLMDFFSVPQRYCEEIRFFQLWFTSHFWFDVAYLVFVLVITLSIANLFKYNENYRAN